MGCWRSAWRPTGRSSRWSGARLKRPLVVGLVFAFGWEPAVLLFPGYLKRLTVAYYLQALVKHEMPQDSAVSMLMQVFHEVPSVWVSLLCLGVIVAGHAVAGRPGRRAARVRAGTMSYLESYKPLRLDP